MLRNPNGLSYAVVMLLGVTAFVDLLGLYATFVLRTAVSGASGGDVAPLDDAVVFLGVVGVLQFLALLVTGILFLVWFHRLRQNAEVWAGDLQERKPGWAIGGWFVPIANFWIPRGVAADIWRASRAEPSAADRPGEFRLLNCWWALFVASAFASRAAGRIYDRAETLEAYASATNWLLASDALDVAAAVSAILFVRRLTSLQHAKATGLVPAAR